MRVCILHLWLISLLRSSFSEECSQELRLNVDFPGSDVLQIYSPDVLHCQGACSQHHSCQFFTFVRPDWTRDDRHFYCYLKHTESGAPSQETELDGVTSGYSLKNCEEKTDTCLSSVYQDVDFYGADYRTLFTADYKECQRACTSDPGCQFFSWLNDDFARPQYKFKCHLKFSWSVPKPPALKILSGVVSGFSQKLFQITTKQCEVCRSVSEIFTNTDFPGHDFEQIPAVSAEHCQFLCSVHPRCTYFSYTTSRFITGDQKQKMLCFLKHSEDEKPMQRKEEVHSGMPSRFCELSRDWVTVRYENTDFPGFDIRYVKLDDPDSCETLCTADPHCQFYTYVFTSFYEPDYRRRCFLKQVITMPVPRKVASLKGVVSGFTLRGCSDPKPDEPTKGMTTESPV
ncbi:plasma kallikrein-like isoform X2 [Clupea harengus]|uniref:Plasma kallikrein-like isoform X2 n=1 Tax=Clupea harengus TaxID=7950 RepID=A0A6P8GSB3_CLUHA|nr:plasma kallikrein-like isoform X2 [Clupea harengus]